MANYLFTLTITPVQSFISQARKTKDLFVGSEILSSLIRNALEKFEKEGHIIFPQNNKFVSNKFVVKLENITEQELKFLEESINNQFYFIGSETLLDMKNITIDMKLFQKYFKPQMCNFFKIFWVAIEYDNSKSYQENYRKLEQNLGAVKNLRTFTQLEQESGRKCSLCGERNGLFYSGKKPKYIIKNAIDIKNNQIQEGESLCSVCFTKRFYNSNSSPYPSTAKIALLDWLKKVENKNQYEKLFNNFDESLYFKDNVSKEYLEKWGYFKNDDNLTKAIEFLDNLEIDSKQKKYYAFIYFDIDNMGKKLSSLDEEGQKELSKALAEFGKEAKDIINRNSKIIYAGGDDFLWFVNLTYLFEVLKEIKEAFKIENLTYSTSIIIAHYKEPLHIVLDRVRATLNKAKEIDKDKNGLVIAVLKHSGETLEMRVKNDLNNIQNIQKIVKLVEEYFSDKFIINLELEFIGLIDKDDKLLVSKDMIKIELERLIKKSLLNKEEKDRIAELFNLLTPFIEHRKMSNFFHLLNIIRFIKRELK